MLLFKQVLINLEISSSQLLKYNFQNVSTKAFEKLINRTKNKIFETLLFDAQLDQYSGRSKMVFRMRKKILLCEVLRHRDMNEEFEFQLSQVISKCKKYEIFDVLIHALQLKQRHFSYIYGERKYQQVEKEIIFHTENLSASIRARSIFSKIAAKLGTKYVPFVYEEIEEAIKILKVDYERSSSSFVGYYFLLLMVEWHHVHENYDEAGRVLNQLLRLVTTKHGVYTKDRHLEVLMNIANNELLKRDFRKSIRYSGLIRKFKQSARTNLNAAREIEFFGRFYNNDLKESEKLAEEIYNSSKITHTPFLFSKRAYLYACIQTIKGNIDKSNELLGEVKEIDKDKEGWNLGKRLLTIINRIESNDLESADLKVLSMEKFIKRITRFRNVRKRDMVILRILLKLINEGFDFSKVYKQRKRYFDLLESNDPDYRWKIKSPEMIIFHEWYKGKMSEQKSRKQLA